MTTLEIALIIYSIGVSIGMGVMTATALKTVKDRKEAWKQAKENEERIATLQKEYKTLWDSVMKAMKTQQSQIIIGPDCGMRDLKGKIDKDAIN